MSSRLNFILAAVGGNMAVKLPAAAAWLALRSRIPRDDLWGCAATQEVCTRQGYTRSFAKFGVSLRFFR